MKYSLYISLCIFFALASCTLSPEPTNLGEIETKIEPEAIENKKPKKEEVVVAETAPITPINKRNSMGFVLPNVINSLPSDNQANGSTPETPEIDNSIETSSVINAVE